MHKVNLKADIYSYKGLFSVCEGEKEFSKGVKQRFI